MTSIITVMLLGLTEPSLQAALQRALTRDAARVELMAWDAPACKGTFAPAPFETSGRVAVRVRGKNCQAWGWAQVRVFVQLATLSRDVKTNESMDGAWTAEDTEPRGAEGLSAVPPGATATRWLRKGMAISANDVRTGPKPGSAITVRVMLGALSLEQRGTVMSACAASQTCASLPSGKKVSGVWDGAALLVGGGS